MARTGPVAWDGVLSFWFPAFDYGIFLMLMAWATYRAIKTDPSYQPKQELVSLSTSAV